MAALENCREELRMAGEELRAQHEELVSGAGRPDQPGMSDRLLDDLPVATLASDRLGVLSAANRVQVELRVAPKQQLGAVARFGRC